MGVAHSGMTVFVIRSGVISGGEPIMKIHYLEIVTPDVEAHCKIYSGVNSAEFGGESWFR